jgi:hypothetical protein
MAPIAAPATPPITGTKNSAPITRAPQGAPAGRMPDLLV